MTRKSPPDPADELKYLTLLRADLVDSTGLVAGLGPEQVMARLEPSLATMRAAVRGFGGIVAKELGDGLLAAFGAPQADDNHATLACHAAMDLVRRIDGLGDANIRVRVGLHSGMVVAQMTATEFSSIYDFRGPALILLERLQAAAEPGQIYLSDACRKLAEGHVTVETLTPRLLKGFPEPVPLHRVAGAGDPSR
ncbi:MAG: adenylate/guanylate cyclase domain-containing protein, partial [Aliidongia sp.]